MNKKPLPSSTDIKDLAKRFKNLWTPGQSVRPFLRKHAALFHELQDEGWSWAGLALALNKAKITYRTNKPWTAHALLQAFSRAKAALKPREFVAPDRVHEHDKYPANTTNVPGNVLAVDGPDARSANNSSPKAAPVAMPEAPSAPVPTAPPAPRFKPVSFRPPQPWRDPTPEELAQIEEARRLTFGHS